MKQVTITVTFRDSDSVIAQFQQQVLAGESLCMTARDGKYFVSVGSTVISDNIGITVESEPISSCRRSTRGRRKYQD